MCERPDDTTEPEERDATPSSRERDAPPEHAPSSYYYDDATGYEIYDPSEDEDEAGNEDDADKLLE